MPDQNNKDYKGFSFIQEHIVSKKKSRVKKMLLSVVWTLVLACIFGVAAGVAFVLSEPTIYKLLGQKEERRPVEFPSSTPDDGNLVGDLGEQDNPNIPGKQPNPTPGVEPSKEGDEEGEGGKKTVIIEKKISGNLEDLISIYGELRGIANQINKSLVTINSISSETDWFKNELEMPKTTTGLVIADNGAELLILTSYDKIKDAKEIQILLWDNTKVTGRLNSYDEELNLSVIALKLDQITNYQRDYIQIAKLGESYLAAPGTPILAMGAPNGYAGFFEFGAITSKLIGIYITDNKVDIFHTDTTYNEKTEGIIVNLDGEVIGIITQRLKNTDSENISTVLGISKIKKIIERLGNSKERVYFGIKAEDMPETALKQFDISHGIYVTEVQADSPALAAGLQSGDVILEVNGSGIVSVQSFQNTISLHEPKASVKVLVKRATKSEVKDIELEVVLGKKN